MYDSVRDDRDILDDDEIDVSRYHPDDVAADDDSERDARRRSSVPAPGSRRRSAQAEDDSGRRSRSTRWQVPTEGDVIGRRYRVGNVLQRTASLVSVAARHLELDQPVVLTYLTPEACERPGRIELFLHEARAIARLPGTHGAKLLDIGRLTNGWPYAVLEQLSGWTLAEVLRMRGRLPFIEATEYVVQACHAVADATVVGIRRTNVNPTNLVLTRTSEGVPIIKVVLFGAYNAAAEEILGANLNGEAFDVLRSLLSYVAPEQVRGGYGAHESGRAEVWAFGAVLYELVTGTPAFGAQTATGLFASIAADPAPRVSRLRPDAPSGFDEAIAQALAKDPAERFASVSELAARLVPFLSEASITDVPPSRAILPSQRPPPLPGASSVARTVTTTSRRNVDVAGSRRSRTRAVGFALAGAIGVGVGALAAVQSVRGSPWSQPESAGAAATPTVEVASERGKPVRQATDTAPPAPLPSNTVGLSAVESSPPETPNPPAPAAPPIPQVPVRAAQSVPAPTPAAQPPTRVARPQVSSTAPAVRSATTPAAASRTENAPGKSPAGDSSARAANHVAVQSASEGASAHKDLFDDMR